GLFDHVGCEYQSARHSDDDHQPGAAKVPAGLANPGPKSNPRYLPGWAAFPGRALPGSSSAHLFSRRPSTSSRIPHRCVVSLRRRETRKPWWVARYGLEALPRLGIPVKHVGGTNAWIT